MSDQEADRAEIIALLHANRIAAWTKDFAAYEDTLVHADYTARWGWWRNGGVFARTGWPELAARTRVDEHPVDLDNAYKTTIENLSLQISDTMAWATFVQHYPGYDVPGRAGPGLVHEFRVFHKLEGGWKIAFIGFLDGGGGPVGSTMLRVDPHGRVVWSSPAADRALAPDNDLAMRSGILRFTNRRADRRLREALAWAATLDRGATSRHGARPIVLEPDIDRPTKIYWVIVDAGMILFAFPDAVDERRLALAAAIYGLSPAQLRVSVLVAEGMSQSEVATRLGVTHNTVRTHLNRIFEKTGVHTQAALVRILLTAVAPF